MNNHAHSNLAYRGFLVILVVVVGVIWAATLLSGFLNTWLGRITIALPGWSVILLGIVCGLAALATTTWDRMIAELRVLAILVCLGSLSVVVAYYRTSHWLSAVIIGSLFIEVMWIHFRERKRIRPKG
jgi:hypothetical protein